MLGVTVFLFFNTEVFMRNTLLSFFNHNYSHFLATRGPSNPNFPIGSLYAQKIRGKNFSEVIKILMEDPRALGHIQPVEMSELREKIRTNGAKDQSAKDLAYFLTNKKLPLKLTNLKCKENFGSSFKP